MASLLQVEVCEVNLSSIEFQEQSIATGGWRCPVINELIRRTIIAQTRATGRGRFKCSRWVTAEGSARHAFVSDGCDRRQIADINTVTVGQSPFDRIGLARLARIDGIRGIHGRQEATEVVSCDSKDCTGELCNRR